MLGSRIAGKYELKRLLGSGSMGAVYEGVHVDLGKRLAIKLIHPEFGDSPEVVARFRREARAASAVESDYIGQIFDFGRDEALGLYMVIEYLEGEDLDARLARERWIGEGEVATIGLQLARGLAKAHAAGIIHRDLKPANIFLTQRDDGSVLAKILDFGISKFEAGPVSSSEPQLTAFGTTLGTPQYMSPEQCEGKVLDGRTDVWSLCAVLYEMIAGEPAVPELGGHILMMQRIVQADIPPLASRAEWVSPALAAVIDAGLARDRDHRIPSAVALAGRLLEANPDAGARSSLATLTRKTDIQDLAPISEPAPSTTSDPQVRAANEAAAAAALAVAPLPAIATPKLADTGNPTSAKPPSSGDPPASSEDGVAIFVRGDEIPKELMALRTHQKKKDGS